MTIGQLLDSLSLPTSDRRDDVVDNLPRLRLLVDAGYKASIARRIEVEAGDDAVPCLLLTLERAREREVVFLQLSPANADFLRARCGDIEVRQDRQGAPPSATPSAGLPGELTRQFERTAELEPEQRAERLLDWLIVEMDASRCGLVPFEGGTPAPPLALRLRGERTVSFDPRHLPRRVIARAAQTRQPVVGDADHVELHQEGNSDTVARQKIQSFMAVPVVFRGELFAVCYLDRFNRDEPFDDAERATFQALAYELAQPLLTLRAEAHRQQYRELRDLHLRGASEPGAPARSPAFGAVLD